MNSEGFDSPYRLAKVSIGLLLANFALALSPSGREFMPADLSWKLAILYAVGCAVFQVVAMRRARAGAANEIQSERLKRFLAKPLGILVIFQLISGFVGFTEGVGSLYTMAAGKPTDITRVVAYSEWRRGRRAKCFKHELVDLSFMQNYFGAPCLDVGYDSGSRFHYRGKVSALGFKHHEVTIESRGEPAHRH